MIDLADYLPAKTIDLARFAAKHNLLEQYVPADPSDIRLMVSFSHSINPSLPTDDVEELLMLHAIGKVLEGGAKVIKPSLQLCRICQEIELHIEIVDYAQPFPGMGVILPGSLFGHRRDLLACSYWAPDKGIFLGVYILANEPIFLFNVVSPHQTGTLEEGLRTNRDAFCPVEGQNLEDVKRITRICTNLALFAVERGHAVEPLGKDDLRRRRRAVSDDRLARLTAREAQEIVIQDMALFLREAREHETGGASGSRQSPHRRRGHWKMQAHGAGRHSRKRVFVQSYLVGFDDRRNANVESTMR